MTALPAAGTFNTDADLEEGELREALEDVRDSVAELIGGSGVQALTIASGLITPLAGASGTIRVDTEAAATTDDLDNIALTNVPDGRELVILIANAGHVVRVRNNTGAATGRFFLSDGLALTLNQTTMALRVRRDGNHFYEVAREGRELVHEVNGGGSEPAFQNSWVSGTSPVPTAATFWKDSAGVVHVAGGTQKPSVTVTDSTIFTLPAGYRPGYDFRRPVYTTVGGTVELGYVSVLSTGDVVWSRIGSAPSTVTVKVQLDGLDFRAAA